MIEHLFGFFEKLLIIRRKTMSDLLHSLSLSFQGFSGLELVSEMSRVGLKYNLCDLSLKTRKSIGDLLNQYLFKKAQLRAEGRMITKDSQNLTAVFQGYGVLAKPWPDDFAPFFDQGQKIEAVLRVFTVVLSPI